MRFLHSLFSVDMLAHAIDNAAPTTIVLISGDRDFAYALSILRFRGYRIVLITLSNAHQSLRAQASISFDWVSEVLEPADPTLSKQPTSNPPRRGKMSSPPSHDKFYADSRDNKPSSSVFQEPYNEKFGNSVEFMNNFQDETRRRENSRTPSKHDAKHDSLPLYLERQLAAASMALSNGLEAPAIVVHSPHTYPNRSIRTPLDTTLAACSSDLESNFASRTIQTQTRLLGLLQTLQDSPLETSYHPDAPSENPQPIHESSLLLSRQQGSPSLNNATRHLSSVDRMAIDDSPPANITASTPSLIPPSPTLSSDPVSAITENALQPTPFPVVADKYKFLVQCLKSHRRPRGSLSLLRSKLGLEVDEDGTTYRVNRRRHISSIIVPDKFKILIRCLKSHRSRGNLYPLRRKISSEIAQNGTTYLLAGVSTFGEYVMMAEKAGIVELGGTASAAWIALKAPWYNVTNARLS
jgi:NYN domain